MRYLRQKYAEKFWSWLADCLPRRLRYQVWINVSADATTDDALRSEEVPAVHLGDLLQVVHRRLA